MDIIKIKSFRRLGIALLCAGVGLGLLSRGLEVAAQKKTITVCAEGCDFVKIQEAIDAAAVGDTIDVKAGAYQENLTIKDKQDLTLQGAGRDQVTLDGSSKAAEEEIIPAIRILNSQKITVRGFKVVNSRRGLWATNTTELVIESNAFENNLRQGILVDGGPEAQIRGNLVQGTRPDRQDSSGHGFGNGIGATGTVVTLTDNTITDNADCGLRITLARVVDSSNNRVQNNKGGNLCGNVPWTVLAAPPAKGSADQVSVPSDAPTVQEALTKVKAGGTITLSSGTYTEQVQIYQSVTIRGEGPEFTVLQAPGSDWTGVIVSTDQIQVTLEGLRVTGARRGVHVATGPAAQVTLRNVKIDGNGNAGSTNVGIYVEDENTLTLDQVDIFETRENGGLSTMQQAKVTLQNSTIAKNGGAGISASGQTITVENSTVTSNADRGIILSGSIKATIRKNTVTKNGTFQGIGIYNNAIAMIEENTITGNAGMGIYLRQSAQATIVNNRITGTKQDTRNNRGWGILLVESAQATIRKNTISDNNDFGVWLTENARATIEDNEIIGNAFAGMVLHRFADATILNNRINRTRPNAQGQLGRGISVEGDSRATIRDNQIIGNAERGIRLLDRAKASIVGNTIRENASQGILLGSTDRANETIQAEISQNIIRDNRGCGVYTDNDPGIKITGQNNIITGNAGGNLCGDTSKFPPNFGG